METREEARRRSAEWDRANAEYRKARALYLYHENRRYGLRVLRRFGCVDCGERDERVLQFDHLDGNTKKNNRDCVTSAYRGSRQRLKIEMFKCVVRCANCHVKKTWSERGFHGLDDYEEGIHVPHKFIDRIKARRRRKGTHTRRQAIS
jgi:hypothetical protein